MEKYQITDMLGQGGQGVVYRALHRELQRDVAIKFLLSGPEDTGISAIARFKREMGVLIALSHRNIIKVYDAGEMDGKLFYVMELLEARDLGRVLDDDGPLPLELFRSVIEQILDALDYIHAKGLVHRDIKPSNIMLEESGRVILMDFGLVRKLEGTVLTAAGTAVGTPRYFSPELIRGHPAQPASDLFALGVIAYELLVGERPFDGQTLKELVASILRASPRPMGEKRSGLPPGLEEVILRLLETEPLARWASAREALMALTSVLGSAQEPLAPAPARPGTRRLCDSEPPHRDKGRATGGELIEERRRASVMSGAWTRPALAGLGLVCLLGLAVLKLHRPTDPPPPWPGLDLVNLSVRYLALDRLSIEFTTPTSLAFGLARGPGQVEMEPAPTTRHRFEVPIVPFQKPEGLVLLEGGRPIRVLPPPPAPADLVRRLKNGVHKAKLCEETTESTWSRIRTRKDDWPGIPDWTYNRGNTLTAARAVAQNPVLVSPFRELVARLDAEGGLCSSLEALRPLVSGLLTEGTPDSIRNELLFCFDRLELVDGLAEYLGLDPPYGVRAAMEPAVSFQVREFAKQSADPFSPGAQMAFRPPTRQGVAIFHQSLNPNVRGLTAMSDLLTSGHAVLKDTAQTAELRFRDQVEPGPNGKRIHIRLRSWSSHSYLCLVPPGLKGSLTIRLPRGTNDSAGAVVWLSVTIKGGLASRTGDWLLKMNTFFKSPSRLFLIVQQVAIERAS